MKYCGEHESQSPSQMVYSLIVMALELLIPLCNTILWTHTADEKWFGSNGSSHLAVENVPILTQIWPQDHLTKLFQKPSSNI